jgi:hypothetical protein
VYLGDTIYSALRPRARMRTLRIHLRYRRQSKAKNYRSSNSHPGAMILELPSENRGFTAGKGTQPALFQLLSSPFTVRN